MNLNEIERYKNIPKIIWILWFQGKDNAPYIVNKCIDSWIKHNPSWKIIFLDEKNYLEYVDISEVIQNNKKYLTKTLLSDIVRINLLNKYGGIWVDSTCYCTKPLDIWIDDFIENDFFMFRPPVKHSPISSWFIMSSNNSKITNILCNEVNNYFKNQDFKNQDNNLFVFINKIVERLMFRTRYTSKIFKILFNTSMSLNFYPYFCFHYTFALTLMKNKEFKEEWEKVKYFNADKPHNLQHYGLFKKVSKSIKEEIDSEKVPIYKLTWKYDKELYIDGCTLHYLLERK